MSCMKIFRLNKKGCYNLINAQNDQYIFQVEDHFVETTKCLKVSSINFKFNPNDSFLGPWSLNIGNHFISNFTFKISVCIYVY